MKIEELNFSVRTRNCLRRGNIETVEQLMDTPDDELMNIRCFGVGCLKEVHQILGKTKQAGEENKTSGGQCGCRKKSAEIQAAFRLGQKDMQESFILLLKDNPHATHEELLKMVRGMRNDCDHISGLRSIV